MELGKWENKHSFKTDSDKNPPEMSIFSSDILVNYYLPQMRPAFMIPSLEREWASIFAYQEEQKLSSHIFQENLDDPQAFWDDVLWTDESKELFNRHVSSIQQ